MIGKGWIFLLAAACSFSCTAPSFPPQAASSPPPSSAASPTSILILNSYHPGYLWSDSILSGMRDTLQKHDPSADLSIEYLDAKRKAIVPGSPWDGEIASYLEGKYRGRAPSLVLCNDYDAYSFLRRWRDRLFGPVPVVFCGVSSPDPGPSGGYTGYLSGINLEPTLDSIGSILPGTRRVLVITDLTPEGRLDRRSMEGIKGRWTGAMEIDFLDEGDRGMSPEAVLAAVSRLGAGDAVFLLDYYEDERGKWVEPSSFVPRLASASKVPIFYHADQFLGMGILGGYCTGSQSLGEATAELGLEILQGRVSPDLPPRPNPVRPSFDARVAARFSVPLSRFPASSRIINAPDDRFSRLLLLLLIALVVVGIQALFIALLMLARRREARMRELLALQADEIKTVFDSSPVGLAYTKDFLIRRVNKRLAEMTGYPDERFRDSRIDFLFADRGDFGRVNEEIQEQLGSGHDASTRATVIRADGTTMDVVVRVNRVDPLDPSKGAISTFIDDSEIRSKDEELAQSRKMQVVGQLAGGIAHDFNNLLGGIMGAAELIGLGLGAGSPAAPHVRTILDAATRGSDLTRKLLSFSRKADIKPKPFDLGSTVESTVAILERSIDKRISVSVESSGPAVIEGEQSIVQNALLNLALNSRDAMPEGGAIRFRISVAQIAELPGTAIISPPEPGSYAIVEISDSGSGIPPAMHRKIFEPFFTTKPLGKGTGLGLSAVYGAIEAHEGALSLESEAGSGATFYLAFPVAAEGPANGNDGEEAEREVAGKGGKVLVIDDEAMVLEVVSSLIESLGYRTVRANSGNAGIEAVREDASLSAVVLDYMMPDLNGKQVFERIRQLRPALPIVFLSGFTGDANLRELRSIGADGYLQKPCTRAMLRDMLNRVVS